MTIKERVEQDGVGMRWLRTAATTIVSLTAALAVIWGAVAWLAAPRLAEYAEGLISETTEDLRSEVRLTAGHLTRLDEVVTKLEANVAALGDTVLRDDSPSWRFSLPDTSISDGAIGGEVVIQAGGFKLKECGIPRVDLYFVNGDGVYHRFINASLLTDGQRGVAFPVDANRVQVVRYTAEIPATDNVKPGRARGFIAVTYPDGCPAADEVVAGPLQFRITPA